MEPAVQPILDELASLEFSIPAFPIAENVSGTLVSDPARLRSLLERHVISPVRWQEDAQALAAAGAATFLVRPRRRAHEDGQAGRAGRERGRGRLARGRGGRGKLGAVTRHATIAGVGSSLPPRLVPNTWFEGFVDTNDEWIRDRTGIEARHFADAGAQTSDLAVEAARGALSSAGWRPSSST